LAEKRAYIPARRKENPDPYDQGRIPDKVTAPVYAEGINMLEGLTEEEADTFLQENPTIVPLYEIDVVKEAEPYQLTEEAAIVELGRAREALERELAVSQRVRPTELEQLNLGTAQEPRNVLIAEGLDPEFKEELTHVLKTYKDVFAWSYEDMKGLNPEGRHSGATMAISP
jgi:hypothetical protein